jgi:LysM repeat protein
MGQLEKYGLYVLCLLIFLIIGVSIWGEPASAGTDPNQKSETAKVAKVDKLAVPRVDIKELTSPVKPPPSPSPAKGNDAPAPLADVGELSGGGGKDAKKSDAPKNEARVEPAKNEPKPESGKRPTHRIKSGDTFESIAIGLGDKKLVPVLLQLNPKLDPKALAIGTEVQLPTTAELAAHKASANGV